MVAVRVKGFERCRFCGTMHGPTPVCPNQRCGVARVCAHCTRVYVPGHGYRFSHAVYEARTITHGICPWCAARAYGGDPKVVSFAAGRLGVPAGLLHVRAKRLSSGGKFLVVYYEGRTGWAGLAKAVAPWQGLN